MSICILAIRIYKLHNDSLRNEKCRQDGVERYEVISARPHIGVLLMAAAVVGGQAIASVAPEKCNLVIIWCGWYIQLFET